MDQKVRVLFGNGGSCPRSEQGRREYLVYHLLQSLHSNVEEGRTTVIWGAHLHRILVSIRKDVFVTKSNGRLASLSIFFLKVCLKNVVWVRIYIYIFICVHKSMSCCRICWESHLTRQVWAALWHSAAGSNNQHSRWQKPPRVPTHHWWCLGYCSCIPAWCSHAQPRSLNVKAERWPALMSQCHVCCQPGHQGSTRHEQPPSGSSAKIWRTTLLRCRVTSWLCYLLQAGTVLPSSLSKSQ